MPPVTPRRTRRPVNPGGTGSLLDGNLDLALAQAVQRDRGRLHALEVQEAQASLLIDEASLLRCNHHRLERGHALLVDFIRIVMELVGNHVCGLSISDTISQ